MLSDKQIYINIYTYIKSKKAFRRNLHNYPFYNMLLVAMSCNTMGDTEMELIHLMRALHECVRILGDGPVPYCLVRWAFERVEQIKVNSYDIFGPEDYRFTQCKKYIEGYYKPCDTRS